jgi:hypothetical protein
MLNIRLAAAVLTTFAEQGGKLEAPYPRLKGIGALAPELGAELRRDLAPRDGWGRELRVLVTGSNREYLISYGADGRPDRRYDEVDPDFEFVVRADDADPASLDRDIVFKDGKFLQRPHPPEPPAKRALADLRSIATALEAYSVDYDAYPGPTAGLQPIDMFTEDLEPEYIKLIPRLDPWGYPYLVASDATWCIVVSGGADGRLESDYRDTESLSRSSADGQPWTEETGDIVFVNGMLQRGPFDSMIDEVVAVDGN